MRVQALLLVALILFSVTITKIGSRNETPVLSSETEKKEVTASLSPNLSYQRAPILSVRSVVERGITRNWDVLEAIFAA